MSEAPIPAWKRAGLKQTKAAVSKSAAAYDPLKEGLKRAGENTDKPAKPAKKPKVAKADKPAPTHELDQLSYLRQYTENKSEWKFSKQKQNWLLKHMFIDITDPKYDEPLLNYVRGLQGSARKWVFDDALEVIGTWNKYMKADLEKENEAENKEKEEAAPDASADKTAESTAESTEEAATTKKQKKKQPKPEPVVKVPEKQMVLRARDMIKTLDGEVPTIEILDSIPEA